MSITKLYVLSLVNKTYTWPQYMLTNSKPENPQPEWMPVCGDRIAMSIIKKNVTDVASADSAILYLKIITDST